MQAATIGAAAVLTTSCNGNNPEIDRRNGISITHIYYTSQF